MRGWISMAALLLFILSGLLAADERILEYRSDIEITPDGELLIIERIRVRAEGNQIRRGIFRDFPTRYRDRLGNRFNAGFDVLEVRRNGQAEPWHQERIGNGVRVYAGSSGRMLTPGVHDYEFRYRTNRQLGYFAEIDELYFNAVGTGWAFPVDHAEATVRFPFEVSPGDLRLSVYTGPQGSTASDARARVHGPDRVHFETTRGLGPREGMTIAVGWPKGLVAEPGLVQKIRWFLNDNGAATALLSGWLLTLAAYLWAWNRVGRDPDEGVIIPRYRPPSGLSPAASRYVLSMSFTRHSFTAAIISLAIKGQLTIEEDDGDYTLIRPGKAPSARLTPGEQAVMDRLLPTPSSRIEMKNENYKDFQAARRGLQQALKKEHLGQLFNTNRRYILPAFLITVATAIAAQFFDGGPLAWAAWVVLTVALHVLFIFLLKAPTRMGRAVMDEIEGFKMYLGTAERDRLDRMRSPELTPEVFESFLPYAYALGVENNWCERFAREMPQELRGESGYSPNWYTGHRYGPRALHHLGDDFGQSFGSAIASASSSPGSSSGSGGGGSSGGGGGGGGGGGW